MAGASRGVVRVLGGLVAAGAIALAVPGIASACDDHNHGSSDGDTSNSSSSSSSSSSGSKKPTSSVGAKKASGKSGGKSSGGADSKFCVNGKTRSGDSC